MLLHLGSEVCESSVALALNKRIVDLLAVLRKRIPVTEHCPGTESAIERAAGVCVFSTPLSGMVFHPEQVVSRANVEPIEGVNVRKKLSGSGMLLLLRIRVVAREQFGKIVRSLLIDFDLLAPETVLANDSLVRSANG
jgi:hypothetical protein